MINFTSGFAIPNATKAKVDDFAIESGKVRVILYYGSGTLRSKIFNLRLSDTAGQSGPPSLGCQGIVRNLGPQGVDDDFGVGFSGAAGSLTAAITAYRGAANHTAGLKAIELRALVDGWFPSEWQGT